MKLTIESGEGEESQECRWSLLEMYWKYCQLNNIKAKWIVRHPVGAGAPERESKILGIEMDSDVLKDEQGVHRIVRISPVDEKARRHTSFHFVVTDDDPSKTFAIPRDTVRSYVFSPYQKVKNHKNEKETKNIEAVFDGHLELIL